MIWRFRRRPDQKTTAADAAIEDTERRLHHVQEQGQEVHKLTETLREYREGNHFTDMLRDSFRRI